MTILFAAVIAGTGQKAHPAERVPIPSDNPSSFPGHLCAVEDALYFAADDGIHGREVWRCRAGGDGALQCELAADVWPGSVSSSPQDFINAEGHLYFVANPGGVQQPFVLSPNSIAARRVVDAQHGHILGEPRFLGVSSGKTYLSACTEGRVRSLHVVKPGDAFTENLSALPRVGEEGRFSIGPDGGIFFYFADSLKHCDGSRASVRDVCVMKDGVDLFHTGDIQVMPWGAAFVGYDPEHGRELWVVRNGPDGCQLLRDIAPGPGSSNCGGFYPHGNDLYFFADDGEHGVELWRSDGTRDGTALVKDICPGALGCDPHGEYVAVAGGLVYFPADDGVHGRELWCTDGTGANTRMVKDLFRGVQGGQVWRPTAFQGRLYFCADSSTFGEELFVTDGTASGTHPVRDIVPGRRGCGPHQPTVLGGLLFFTCDDGKHGEELWVTDGTAENTRLVADIYPLRFNPPSAPRLLRALGARVFFTVSDRNHGEELWVSDGTGEGTQLVLDIAEGTADSRPEELTPAGERLFFAAWSPKHGRELWCSDGTSRGTSLVKDLAEGKDGCDPKRLCARGESVYFTACPEPGRRTVWRSDGSPEGTRPLAWGDGVGAAHQVTGIVCAAGEVLIGTKAPDASSRLWRVDPDETIRGMPDTPPGPNLAILAEARGAGHPRDRATRPASLGDRLLFTRHCDSHGAELWRMDSSRSGEELVRDIYPGPPSSSPTYLTRIKDTVYFVAEHPTYGRVLWQTDGSTAATNCVILTSDNGERFTPPVVELTATEDTLVMCSLPALGREAQPDNAELRFLRHERGEEREGDVLLNLRTGPAGSWPRQLTPAGGLVFFTADDGVHGEELWVTDGTAAGTRIVKDILEPGDLAPLQSQ